MTVRAPGYYWIREPGGHVLIAVFKGPNSWLIPGDTHYYDIPDDAVVGPVVRPTDAACTHTKDPTDG